MNPAWILLIVLNGYSSTAATAPFYTQEACLNAAREVKRIALNFDDRSKSAVCVPSGAFDVPR